MGEVDNLVDIILKLASRTGMKCKQQGQMLMDSMDNCFWTAKSKTGIGPGPDNALDVPMGLVHVGGSGPEGALRG